MSCRECSLCNYFGNDPICPTCGRKTSWDEDRLGDDDDYEVEDDPEEN